MNGSKSQFFQRPRIRDLSLQEKERRWRQHQNAFRNPAPFGTQHAAHMESLSLDPLSAYVHTTPKCGRNYMHALTDPFSLHEEVCIPDLYAIPSKKVRAVHKFNMSSGTTGFGFIALCQQCKSNNDSVLYSSTSLYAGGNAIPSVGQPNTAAYSASKLPYAASVFEGQGNTNPGIQGRVVGVSMRVRYVGPLLARGGQLVALRHPDNETLVGKTYDEIKGYETAKTFPISTEWTYLTYRPVKPKEYEFSPDPATASDAANFKWEAAFLMYGTTTSSGIPGPAPFEFELVQHIEYIGRVDNVTKSHASLMAMSHIRNNLNPKSATNAPHKHFIRQAMEIGKDVIKNESPGLLDSITKSATNAILNKAFKTTADKGGNILSNAFKFIKSPMQSSMKLLKDVFSGNFGTTFSKGLEQFGRAGLELPEVAPEFAALALI